VRSFNYNVFDTIVTIKVMTAYETDRIVSNIQTAARSTAPALTITDYWYIKWTRKNGPSDSVLYLNLRSLPSRIVMKENDSVHGKRSKFAYLNAVVSKVKIEIFLEVVDTCTIH